MDFCYNEIKKKKSGPRVTIRYTLIFITLGSGIVKFYCICLAISENRIEKKKRTDGPVTNKNTKWGVVSLSSGESRMRVRVQSSSD